MRQALLSLAAGMSLFILTADLTAQTLPLPVLPPPTVPVSEPEPTPKEPRPAPTPKAKGPETAAAPAEYVGRPRPQPWEYELAFGVVADTNIDFRVPDGAGGTAIVPDGRIIRNLSTTRGELRAETSGRWIGYPSQDALDRTYFAAGLQGDYRPSVRTSWRGGVHYWLGYTDSTPTLVEQGVALPLGRTGDFSGELGLERKVGARTFVRAEGRFLATTFEDPAYIDGSSLRGTVVLGRQLGARDSASVAYSIEDVLAGAIGTYVTHYGSLQWTHTFSQRSALLLEAGASYTPEASQVGLERGEGFFGGVSFLRQVGRSSLTAYLRREVAPAFGLGVSRLEYRAGLRADVPLGRNWTLSVAAYHIQPANPKDGEAIVFASSSDVSAAFDRRLGRLFTLSGEGRYRRRGETASQPAISAFQGGLFLAVGTPKR